MELRKHLKQSANHTLSRLNLTPKLLISYISLPLLKNPNLKLKNQHTYRSTRSIGIDEPDSWLYITGRKCRCGDEQDSAEVAVSAEWETMGFGFGVYAHSNLCYSPKDI